MIVEGGVVDGQMDEREDGRGRGVVGLGIGGG